MDNEIENIYVMATEFGLLDPITQLPARDENSISALLCIYHQQGKIDWAQVPLLDLNKQEIDKAEAILGQAGALSSEYPLFWSDKPGCDAYGSMRPDFLYIANNGQTAAIIENKLGAGLTLKLNDGYGGQFGRYIQYLKQATFEHKYMILLTSEYYLSRKWYDSDLLKAEEIQKSASSIQCAIIRWEDVLKAVRKA